MIEIGASDPKRNSADLPAMRPSRPFHRFAPIADSRPSPDLQRRRVRGAQPRAAFSVQDSFLVESTNLL